MNKTYSEKGLTELKGLNWIDSWANFKADDLERYTWFGNTGNGFRLDYAFLSPKISEQIEIIDISMILNLEKIGYQITLLYLWNST